MQSSRLWTAPQYNKLPTSSGIHQTKRSTILLKKTIFERFGVCEKTKLRQLLSGIPLHSKKPSQLLRDIKNMALNNLTDAAIHELWIEKLPPELLPYLVMSDDLQLDQLAKMADRIISRLCLSKPVMSTSVPQHSDSLPFELSSIHTRLSHLEKTIINLSQDFKTFKSKSSSSRPRGSSLSTTQDGMCFYHKKFGNLARRCTSPCTFAQQSQENPKRCQQ